MTGYGAFPIRKALNGNRTVKPRVSAGEDNVYCLSMGTILKYRQTSLRVTGEVLEEILNEVSGCHWDLHMSMHGSDT